MSKQKLPWVNRPLFKNTLQKQQIYHRMQIHKQKIDRVNSSKSKFILDFNRNANQTYRQLLEQNPKRGRILQTKYMQVDRENKYLFQKISKAHKSRRSNLQSSRSQERVKSMNITIRRKQIEQIQIQNVKLLSRITSQRPSMSFKEADKHFSEIRKFSQKLSKIEKYKLQDWY